nr:chorismate-binding protein [Streptomyces sp. SID8354]
MAPVTPAPRHYQQLCLDGPFDTLAVVAQLTASGLLTDYVVYEQDEHWHIAGNPVEDIRLRAGDVRTTPWEPLRAALARTPVEDWHAYGWLSFELASGNGSGGDELLGHLIVPGVELTVSRERTRIRTLDPSLTDRLRKVIAEAPPHAEPPAPVPVDEHATDRSYHDQVAHAVAEIGRGRLDKVILSRTVPVPYTVDMTATYVRGRAANTPARSFLLDLDGLQAAGFSPETVIEVTADGSAVTQPLAGTRALHGDPTTDRALRAELFRDPKEVYEHATSVKLAVEELSTVGASDTTRVSEFLTVKPRGSVQHLASRVATQLAEGRTAWDALGAVFPPVTPPASRRPPPTG